MSKVFIERLNKIQLHEDDVKIPNDLNMFFFDLKGIPDKVQMLKLTLNPQNTSIKVESS